MRAQRKGWDDHDRHRRYRRQLAALERGLDRASARHHGAKAAALQKLAAYFELRDRSEARRLVAATLLKAAKPPA